MNRIPPSRRRPTRTAAALRAVVLLVLAITVPAVAHGQENAVFFSKFFSPGTIAPGGVTTLVFEIATEEDVPVVDLAFTDVLPAGVVIASPASLSNDCDGSVSAQPGGSTISLSEGRLAVLGFCQITVDVTSDAPGTHTNVSGDLTHSLGTTPGAEADLVVDADLPGFAKSFAPDAILVGETSTITFTLTNPGAPAATGIEFTDNLPAGVVVADPAGAATDCSEGTVTAVPGSGSISFADGLVAGMTSCTITVTVVATTPGSKVNRTSSLTSDLGTSGRALATLQVSNEELLLSKEFLDDPAVPGGTVTLELTVRNLNRTDAAVDVSFTDDLGAALGGLEATGLPAAGVCGPGSTLSGTTVLTLAGGNLGPAGSCTFQVVLQVPSGAASGSYLNTTSEVTGDVGGRAVAGDAASDTLEVVTLPLITKDIVEATAAPGETLTLDFTITNTSAADTAEDVVFSDVVELVPGTTVSTLPAPGFCGAGSQLQVVGTGSGDAIVLGANPGEEGTLAAGGDCSFSVVLQLPASVTAGVYTNTTSGVTATVGGVSLTGPPASDSVALVGPPLLSKSFADPVLPGDTVTLTFVLELPEDAPGDATGITFTDDLDATLGGLVAVGLPADDVCGAGSQLSGTSVLTLSGGTVAPGDTCVFSATLQVPAAAAQGVYPNTTSAVTATMLGEPVTGDAATDDLDVAALELTKEFLAPAVAGGTSTLRFTVGNQGGDAATDIAFTDDLDAVLTGLVAVGLPVSDVCGTGSEISGTSVLALTGGNLAAGEVCTFDVTVSVPGGAAAGEYLNVTSSLSATVGGTPVTLGGADDLLTVLEPLSFAKSFVDDPAQPGGTVTLRFTITNDHPTEAATDLTFTDDLDAVLSGLEATGLPLGDVCGAGSTVSGTSVVTLTGGTVPAGGFCTFDVTLQIPASVASGTGLVNTTSALTGMVGGFATDAPAASDTLRVVLVSFEKSFDGAVGAGGTVVLTFTLTNDSTAATVDALSFLDDLSAVLAGLTAVGLPASDVCGTGSQITGSSVLSFSGGSLAPGETCTFDVTLSVPADAAPGDYLNTTSDLVAAGLPAAEAAAATLRVEVAPAFSKAFAPASVGLGEVSTLTFGIDNAASGTAATGLDFSDTLPAGLVVAPVPNAATTCTGGVLTAVAGSSTVSYTGGSVAAGAACTVVVDVLAMASGSLLNTSGELTSSLGSSGTASATLVVGVAVPPAFSKAFAPASVELGEVSTLTFGIDNAGSAVAATGLDFTDTLPAGLVVAPVPNAATTCTGGVLTAVAGSSTVGYTGGSVAAGAACTVEVDVLATAPGPLLNTSGDLTSSLGSSGAASATLVVGAVVPVTEIPTLSELALLLLSGLLTLLAWSRLRG